MCPRTMLGTLLEEAGQPGLAMVEVRALTPLDLQASGPRLPQSLPGAPRAGGPCLQAASRAHTPEEVTS